MSTTRNNSTNPGQDAGPAQSGAQSTPPPSDPAGLWAQVPPSPTRLIATVARTPRDNPRDQPLRAHLPAAAAAAPSPPPAPAPPRFRDLNIDPRPVPAPWPAAPPGARRCPHRDLPPCFCRDDTDRRGFACRRCRFGDCPANCLRQRHGSVEARERALQAERAGRFDQELWVALDDAAGAERPRLRRVARAGFLGFEGADFAASGRRRGGSPDGAGGEGGN